MSDTLNPILDIIIHGRYGLLRIIRITEHVDYTFGRLLEPSLLFTCVFKSESKSESKF